jgi:hypothetical protein
MNMKKCLTKGHLLFLASIIAALVSIAISVYLWPSIKGQFFTSIPNPLPPKTAEFVCPTNGWVDCMPIFTPEKKRNCSTRALSLFKANCPNFKGVAQ